MYMAVAPCPEGVGAYPEPTTYTGTGETETRRWYEVIIDAVGDVGRETIERVRQYIVEEYSPEVWDRMSEEERRAAARAAFTDYQSRYAWVPWAVGGAVATAVLLRMAGRR